MLVSETKLTKYYCPDCERFFEFNRILIRCKYCSSLNLERHLTNNLYIKADAGMCSENRHLIRERF